ncbi:hypothetical protein BIW11_06354 [Tropilaelaps mercedesae]|uniref:Uncharacterized protein n=1 Tax=Tropilaelaps mercedesae TaxID=418985 RepID=A0A1V9XYH4_9ACAR|nr:hypothetical protein BIW11_06354 [Tropilaelaps mercedesae]
MCQDFDVSVQELALTVRDEPEIYNRHVIHQYLRPPLETIWEDQGIELEIGSEFDPTLGLTTAAMSEEEEYLDADDKPPSDSPLCLERTNSDLISRAPSMANSLHLSNHFINLRAYATRSSVPAFIITTERPVFQIFVDQTDSLPKPQYEDAKNMAQRQPEYSAKADDKGLAENFTDNAVRSPITTHNENSLEGKRRRWKHI